MTQTERYEPTDDPRVKGLIAKARRTNVERDKDDGGTSGLPLDIRLRTVLSALMCGISMKDWDCVAEGVAMLQDVEVEVRMAQT